MRPQLIRDITALERIQRRATKYILNDYTSSYKLRLEQLHLLPLMYHYELQDVPFLIKSLKSPTDNFNIYNYITFARGNTRSGINQKLNHPRTSSVTQHHFYFNRIARLYNYLPVIDLSLSTNTIKYRLTNYTYGRILLITSTLRELVHFTFCALATAALERQFLPILTNSSCLL